MMDPAGWGDGRSVISKLPLASSSYSGTLHFTYLLLLTSYFLQLLFITN